ncbi:unnamed protein product [Lactuca saligna]|uniref:DUF4283 domain-containing protein n=1 Tax=Lactuca saligna TaxID=75948 RepID=A0AA35Y8L4_LACSI|nr:unnamed protein product [Lactuca saligna]
MEWFCKFDSGDVATINCDRIAWIKISCLLPELWSEENFTLIAESVGRVIVSFEVNLSAVNLSFGKVGVLTDDPTHISKELLVEIKGKITKIRILEFDFDWVPFKSTMENFIPDDEGDEDMDEDEEEEHISDTIPFDDNGVSLEDGEFISPNVDEVKESSMESSELKSYDDSWSPVVTPAPVNVVMNEEDWGNGNDSQGDHQESHMGMNVHGESQWGVENINNNENNNVENNNMGSKNGISNEIPYNLTNFGIFGPFPNNFGSIENHTEVNFDSSHNKRRRTVPLPDSDTESASPSMEIRNTVAIGNMLGFDMDEHNPVLRDVVGEEGENHTFR